MKNNWQTKKLGEICEVIGGGTPSTSVLEYWKGEVAWVTPKDLGQATKDVIFDSGKKISKKGLLKSSAKLLPKGSVILSSRAPIGYVAIAGIQMATSQGCRSFICNDKIIFNKYLLYFLKLNTDMLNDLGGGSTFKEVSGSKLKEIEIQLPDVLEQERIVKRLDEVFEKIEKAKENTEKNIQSSHELFESYLQNIFNNNNSWTTKNMEDVVEITSSKRIFKSEYIKRGIPFYRTKEVVELESGKPISLELFISEERYDEIKNKYGVPAKGDLLLTAIGTIGNVYVVKSGDVFYFKDGNILWLKPKKDINSEFIRYAIKSYVEVLKRITIGTAYNALTIEKLKNHKIPVTNSKEQEEIVKKLDLLSEQTKKLEENYKKKLADLEELKKSILQKVFAGEL